MMKKRVLLAGILALVIVFVFIASPIASPEAQEPAGEKSYYRITIFSDIHLPGRNVPFKQKVVETVNSWVDVDMVVGLGDLCEEFGTAEQYDYVKKFFSQLNKPFCPIVGNHDYLYEDSNIPGKHVKASYSIRKKKLLRFKDAFGLQEVFYSKKVGNYLLIFLSIDDLYSDNQTEISGDQLKWLQAELSKKKEIPTIIFFHAPLKGTIMGEHKWLVNDKNIAQPEKKMRKIILDNPQIFIWVSGHWHLAPTNASFNHKVNVYEDRVLNIHNCDMDGRSWLSENDHQAKAHDNIWTNSLYLFPDKVVVKTYDHKNDCWLKDLEREISIPQKK
jgi:Icc protein